MLVLRCGNFNPYLVHAGWNLHKCSNCREIDTSVPGFNGKEYGMDFCVHGTWGNPMFVSFEDPRFIFDLGKGPVLECEKCSGYD